MPQAPDDQADDLPDLMTIAELARVSRFKQKSLRNAVYEGRHIGRHVVRVGRRLMWHRPVVLRWLRGELEA